MEVLNQNLSLLMIFMKQTLNAAKILLKEKLKNISLKISEMKTQLNDIMQLPK